MGLPSEHIEVSFLLKNKSSELKEIIIAELSDLGFDGFMEEERILKAYITPDIFDLEKIKSLYIFHNIGSDQIEISWQSFEKKNWNRYWEENFSPVYIGKELIVKAPFHNSEDFYRYNIILEPKMAFGTGHHASTYLMLEYMLQLNFKDLDVADIGCGTGVLAILAFQMGANRVLAIDNNDWAYQNALENIRLNNADTIEILNTEIQELNISGIDIILANINRNVLLYDMPLYRKVLSDSGKLIMSGILEEDFNVLDQTAKENSLKLIYKNNLKNWLVLHYEFSR